MSLPAELVLVANARLPSARAQSLQVMQAAAAFARAGVQTTLLHAERAVVPALPAGADLFTYYAVPVGPRPEVVAARCTDAIDSFPRALQYLPARLQELTFARNAARWLRAQRPEAAVLSRELEVARHLLRKGRANVFLEIHRVPGGGTRQRWLKEAASGAAGVLAISGGVSADLAALGVDEAKLRIEHDALDPARFADPPEKAEARRRLGLPVEGPLVVYTGGLMEWKGVDVLVEAARGLPEVQFAIAGGMAQDVERVRARAGGLSNVRVDGFKPPGEVPLYLAAGDLAVVPNRSEPAISARYTSPLKVFEAMAAGIPLVVSDLPALREILGHDEALFVPPDDPVALAAALRRLLDDPGTCARLAAGIAARAPEATWDARARRILGWMGGAQLMRALFLTDSLSDLDGVGRYAMRLIAALEALRPGFEPRILLGRKHRPTSADVPPHWDVSVGLPPDYFYYMSPLRFAASLELGVRKAVKKGRAGGRVDVVHAIKDFPHNLLALRAARKLGVPCIATAHGTYSVAPLQSERHSARARRTYEGLDGMVAVSSYTARRITELTAGGGGAPRRLIAVPNAVDAGHYTGSRELGERPWHAGPFVLSIGELKERKGIHLALEAFCRVAPKLAGRFAGLRYFIVGRASGDDYHRGLVARAEAAGLAQRVHFLGNVSEDEKIDLLQRAEVFLHTPVQAADGGFEGFGIVYLEAAAAGTPAIGTTGCGAEDAIVQGETGRLVAPEPQAVSEVLAHLLEDEALRARMGAAARSHAGRSSWERNARKVLALYDEVLGEVTP